MEEEEELEAIVRITRVLHAACTLMLLSRPFRSFFSSIPKSTNLGNNRAAAGGSSSSSQRRAIDGVKHIVAVASGKGGVGKSTVAGSFPLRILS